MAGIQQPRKSEYGTSANTVLAVEEVRTLVVSYAGPDGKVEKALIMAFGKTGDKKKERGVFVLADEVKMSSELKVATPYIQEGVRKWLDKQDAQDRPVQAPTTKIDLLSDE
jgi:hypothetical protein